MTTLEAVVAACIESGTLLIALCALVIVPFVIWTLSRVALPLLREIGNDRSRAVCSGLLAIAPGASFAVASAVVIARAMRAGCLDMPGGRVVIAVIAMLLVLAFGRAVVIARKRQVEVDELICRATPAARRLTGLAAADATIPVLEIDAEEPFIFVAGLRRPSIYVSSAALERLGDAELRAALAHERAHARHGDQMMMAAVLFCTDLVPMNVDPLTELYRNAREFAADHAAIQTADSIDLASAILSVVSPRHKRAVAALADACVKARLSWLLNGAHASHVPFPWLLNYLMIGQIALLVGLAISAVVLPGCRIVS